jgi:hypothetical protein
MSIICSGARLVVAADSVDVEAHAADLAEFLFDEIKFIYSSVLVAMLAPKENTSSG